MSNVIIINGVEYDGSGTIVVSGSGVVTIDGKVVDPQGQKEIHIVITGNVDSLQVDACNDITVNGNVNDLNVKAGNVKCELVSGSIKTASRQVNIGSIKTASFD